jgi:hypothetical protein
VLLREFERGREVFLGRYQPAATADCVEGAPGTKPMRNGAIAAVFVEKCLFVRTTARG